VPYGLMAAICALTLVAVLRRRTPRAAVG